MFAFLLYPNHIMCTMHSINFVCLAKYIFRVIPYYKSFYVCIKGNRHMRLIYIYIAFIAFHVLSESSIIREPRDQGEVPERQKVTYIPNALQVKKIVGIDGQPITFGDEVTTESLRVDNIASKTSNQPVSFTSDITIHNNTLLTKSGNISQGIALQPVDGFNVFNTILDVVLGSDGSGEPFLFVAFDDGKVEKVNPRTMSTTFDSLTASLQPITSLTLGGDGSGNQFLFAGSEDTTVYKIDPSDMSQVDTFNNTLSTISDVVIGDDGTGTQSLFVSTLGNEIIKLDPSDMSQIASNLIISPPTSFTLSENGSLFIGLDNGEVRKYNADDLSRQFITGGVSASDSVTSIIIGDDGTGSQSLFIGSADTTVYKAEPIGLNQLATFDNATEAVTSAALGTDIEGNQALFVGSKDDTIYKVDPENMDATGVSFDFTPNDIGSLEFGDDGSGEIFVFAAAADDSLYKIEEFLGTVVFDVTQEPNGGMTIQVDENTNNTLNFNGLNQPTSQYSDYNVLLIDANGSQVKRSTDTADASSTISSRQYKQKIGYTEVASQRLMEASPVSFAYRDPYDDGHIHYGVIAEEFERRMPELVRYTHDGEPDAVRYIEMIPLLLRRLQYQEDVIHRQGDDIRYLYDLLSG